MQISDPTFIAPDAWSHYELHDRRNVQLIHPTFITPNAWTDYELIDCGDFEKLERFGDYVIARPEPQALWKKHLTQEEWEKTADAYFRKDGKNEERGVWQKKKHMPAQWTVHYRYNCLSLTMRLGLTAFKHVGLFPEQAANWNYIADTIRTYPNPPEVLNLFAYTGGASLAARQAGAKVTHVDSVRQVIAWSRENMALSGCDNIRWIAEDARKFVKREIKRGRKYDGILLDPPAYGRGSEGEKWILEQDIYPLLKDLDKLLSDDGFLVLNLYSMGLSALLAKELLHQIFRIENIEFGELFVIDRFKKNLPLGVFARFQRQNNK